VLWCLCLLAGLGLAAPALAKGKPRDQRPPALRAATANGPTLTLAFDEAVRPVAPAAVRVRVNGEAWRAVSVAAVGTSLRATLAPAVPAGAEITLSLAGVRDRAGNRAAAIDSRTVVNETPTQLPDGSGSFAFRLQRADLADRRGGGYIAPQLTESAPKPDWFLPSRGEFRALMLHVDFPDAPAPRSADAYFSRWSSHTPAWYREASYGRLNYTLTDVPRWYRMSRASMDYGVGNCCPKQAMHDFMAEAIRLADGDVDYKRYDAVFVIASETSAFNITLWRAFPTEGVQTADGKEIRFGVFAPGYLPADDALQAHNIFTHESGHMLGIPDVYGRECPTCGDTHVFAGFWDIMENTRPGAHFFAWHKWNLGWLDTSQLRGLTAPGTLETTVTPLEVTGGVKAVVVPVKPTLAYVLEVRQPIGEDSDICDKGVLLYTVDATIENGMGAVRVKQASPPLDAAKAVACGPQYAAPFDLGAGEVSRYADASVQLEVLAANADGSYRVRVTKT
jgi:M6 family metalloprotease-like protein